MDNMKHEKASDPEYLAQRGADLALRVKHLKSINADLLAALEAFPGVASADADLDDFTDGQIEAIYQARAAILKARGE